METARASKRVKLSRQRCITFDLLKQQWLITMQTIAPILTKTKIVPNNNKGNEKCEFLINIFLNVFF